MNINSHNMIQFIFADNKHKVDMQMGGLETTKDLFKMCMHLLWQGLIFLHGVDGDVVLEDLTYDDFIEVKLKLKNVGIECILDITEIEDPILSVPIPPIHTQMFMNTMFLEMDMDDDEPLDKYVFELQTRNHIFKIKFELFHSVNDAPKNILR